MAQRTKPKSAGAPAFYLAHRYMDALRFDGVLEYPVPTSSGRWRWRALPLPEAPSVWRDKDPQGIWWCVRQCAAVMAPHMGSGAPLAQERAPHPEVSAISHSLQDLLPNCVIRACKAGSADKSAADSQASIAASLAQVLQSGGCALLRIQADALQGVEPAVHWVWMVGVEVWHGAPTRLTPSRTSKSPAAPSRVHAILVLSPRWPAAWGCGFGAKMRLLRDGRWQLCTVDGQLLRGRLTAMVVVQPEASNQTNGLINAPKA